MYCLGKSGKRVNVISRAQGKILMENVKLFYIDEHFKINSIDWNLNDKSVMFHYNN